MLSSLWYHGSSSSAHWQAWVRVTVSDSFTLIPCTDGPQWLLIRKWGNPPGLRLRYIQVSLWRSTFNVQPRSGLRRAAELNIKWKNIEGPPRPTFLCFRTIPDSDVSIPLSPIEVHARSRGLLCCIGFLILLPIGALVPGYTRTLPYKWVSCHPTKFFYPLPRADGSTLIVPSNSL